MIGFQPHARNAATHLIEATRAYAKGDYLLASECAKAAEESARLAKELAEAEQRELEAEALQ